MEGKSVLGKGLSALITDDYDVDNGQADRVVHIEIEKIEYNSLQPRTDYDLSKLNDLKNSIQERGILQPILVRKRGEAFEVVAGERRLRAAKELGLSKIPAIVKNLTDQDVLVIALVENIQREELNPIEEARAYKRLIEEFGYTHDTIAQSVSKNRSTVSNMLRLLNLHPDIQKEIFSKRISVGHARAILSLDSTQQADMVRKVIEKGLSVRELEAMISGPSNKTDRSKRALPRQKDHEIAALEDEFQKILGTKVSVQSKKKRGKIIIEYYSPDDLDRLIQLLRK